MKAKEKPQNVEPIVETPDKKDETTIQAAKITAGQTVIVAVIGALALFGNSYISKPSPNIEETKVTIEYAEINQKKIIDTFDKQIQVAEKRKAEINDEDVKNKLDDFIQQTKDNKVQFKEKSIEGIEYLKTKELIKAEGKREDANKISFEQNQLVYDTNYRIESFDNEEPIRRISGETNEESPVRKSIVKTQSAEIRRREMQYPIPSIADSREIERGIVERIPSIKNTLCTRDIKDEPVYETKRSMQDDSKIRTVIDSERRTIEKRSIDK